MSRQSRFILTRKTYFADRTSRQLLHSKAILEGTFLHIFFRLALNALAFLVYTFIILFLLLFSTFTLFIVLRQTRSTTITLLNQ